MPQWEYLTVEEGLMGRWVYAVAVNGEDIPPSQRVRIDDYINSLGEQGWEWVGASTWAIKHLLYFKRFQTLVARAIPIALPCLQRTGVTVVVSIENVPLNVTAPVTRFKAQPNAARPQTVARQPRHRRSGILVQQNRDDSNPLQAAIESKEAPYGFITRNLRARSGQTPGL